MGEETLNDEKHEEEKEVQGSEGNTGTATVTLPASKTDTKEDTKEDSPSTLSAEEEKVIRMLYGKTLQGQDALEFANDASMETRLKLALIEANLLEAFQAGALDPDPATGAPRSVFFDKLSLKSS